MKCISRIILLALITTFSTSCSGEKDLRKIQQRSAKQAETYDLVETDRVVDAYFKKFRIAAPKGTVLELDESRDICYRAVSGDKKSTVYVVSKNANEHKKNKFNEYEWKKKYIYTLDTITFNLGECKEKRSIMGIKTRIYDVDEETEAITKTYYSKDYAYLLCVFYPKNDSSYADEVVKSFSPSRILPPAWFTMLLVALTCVFWKRFSKSKKCIWSILGILTPVLLTAMYLAPTIIEYSRGYILFKSILGTIFSIFT